MTLPLLRATLLPSLPWRRLTKRVKNHITFEWDSLNKFDLYANSHRNEQMCFSLETAGSQEVTNVKCESTILFKLIWI